MTPQLELWDDAATGVNPPDNLSTMANLFLEQLPYRHSPFNRRNWGGVLHSLCSYQGKLKPSIAHFLVSRFTLPGSRILDPLAGVGTIPLEARRLGRVGVANDMSGVAASVASAKLLPFKPADVWNILAALEAAIARRPASIEDLSTAEVDFGLNGRVADYFHVRTLKEIVVARAFFGAQAPCRDAAADVVRSSLLHILHGNRPYALSRRSHPVTPFRPTGPFEYRPLVPHLATRLRHVVPELARLAETSLPGESYQADFRALAVEPVDTVITSPPFARSVRFWSSNWLRLWFTGWGSAEFRREPQHYLEHEQRSSYSPYRELADMIWATLKPSGLLILHLGQTKNVNMAREVIPQFEHAFEIEAAGHEGVLDGESHGLRDKGATIAHWYVFARRRAIRSVDPRAR